MGFHVECEQGEDGETRVVSVCRARDGAVEPATLTQMALCEDVSLVMVRRRIEVAVLAAVLRGAVDAPRRPRRSIFRRPTPRVGTLH